MKKTLFLLLVLFVVSSVSQVFAYNYGVSAGDTVKWGGAHAGNGGEFDFSVVGTGFSWTTFCAERSQYLAGSTTVDSIGDSNWNGTKATGKWGSKGFLTDTAAWAYWNFSEGTLGSEGSLYAEDSFYDGSRNDQKDLQQLIWFEMGQIKNASYSANTKVYDWLALASNDINAGWTNNGLVKVLQFDNNQDVLIAATNTNPVPEPASMALLGIGLIGLVVVGRKKVKKN